MENHFTSSDSKLEGAAESVVLRKQSVSGTANSYVNTMLVECLKQVHSLQCMTDNALKSKKDHHNFKKIELDNASGAEKGSPIATTVGAGASVQRNGTVYSSDQSFLLSKGMMMPMTEDDDDEQVALALFDRLVAAAPSFPYTRRGIRQDELHTAAMRFAATSDGERSIVADIAAALETGDDTLRSDGILDFGSFLQAFRAVPVHRGERVRWTASLGLHGVLARLIPLGDAVDGLSGLRRLDRDGEEALVRAASVRLVAVLPDLMRKGFERLRQTAAAKEALGKAAAEQSLGNSKFVGDGLTVGEFATLGDFHRGPELLIGAPNPRIYEGIEKEHLRRENSNIPFTASNYNISTTPIQEWEIVVNPRPSQQYPHTPYDRALWPKGTQWKGKHGRQVVGVDELMEQPNVLAEAKRAGLRREEVICLRLYTGPMFVLYNAALRGLPARDVELLRGNRYERVFTIASVCKMQMRGADSAHLPSQTC